MKIFLIFIILYSLSLTVFPQFVIKARIKGSPDSLMYILEYREVGKYATIDTAYSKKGKIKIKGNAVQPAIVHLYSVTKAQRLKFYIENSVITISAELEDLENAKVTGSKTQDEFESFVVPWSKINNSFIDLKEKYSFANQSNDLQELERIRKEVLNLRDEQKSLLFNFVQDHPASWAAPEIIAGFSNELNTQELEELVLLLDTGIAKSPLLRSVNQLIEKTKNVAIGKKAPDFRIKDTNGIPVSLSSRFGKKTLILYFWASWDTASRQVNQELMKIYKRFMESDLEVFAISLDYDGKAWKEAIDHDQLNCTNISDLRYDISYPAQLYAVSSLPAIVIIDRTGTIIGRNIWGEELIEFLNKHLN